MPRVCHTRSSANPSVLGASVTFTATVNGSAPTGTVAFTADNTTLIGCGSVALPTGSANSKSVTCSTASLAVGTHSIVATYAGDAANNGSTSPALSQLVNSSSEVVWVEDSVPAGAVTASDGGDAWNWISSNPPPYAGALAHQSLLASGEHQHYFYGATATLAVGVGDTLFTYVYLDPANLPSEVMLQWNDGSWEHRAYWGANLIGWGTDGTVSRRYMGPLPATGQWVRLAVPAAQMGLEGRTLNGMAFTLVGHDYYPTSAYATLSAESGTGKLQVAKLGVGPEDGFAAYPEIGGIRRPRWGDYSATAIVGSTIWFATEYIGQTCNEATFLADTTCGGTRTINANWDTRISHANFSHEEGGGN